MTDIKNSEGCFFSLGGVLPHCGVIPYCAWSYICASSRLAFQNYSEVLGV